MGNNPAKKLSLLLRWKFKRHQKKMLKKKKAFFMKLREVVLFMKRLDDDLKRQHYNRKQRRSFWHDLIRNENFRNDLFNRLLVKYSLEVEAIDNYGKKKKAKPKEKRYILENKKIVEDKSQDENKKE